MGRHLWSQPVDDYRIELPKRTYFAGESVTGFLHLTTTSRHPRPIPDYSVSVVPKQTGPRGEFSGPGVGGAGW